MTADLRLLSDAADAHAIDRMAALHATAFPAGWSSASLSTLLDQDGVGAVLHPDGFVLIRAVAGEAEILTLAVRPEARRCGLGARLVRAAIGLARSGGAQSLFLEVAEDNEAARALYAAMGFGMTGRRRAYYPRAGGVSVDALLLVLNLSSPLPSG